MKNRSFKRQLFLAFVAFMILFGIVRVYYRVTDDFRLSNMTYEIPHNKEWEIPELRADQKADLKQILGQEYTYLGKGAQSYVFTSEDGRYVIKFFKFKHLKPSLFLSMIPRISILGDYRTREELRKDRKLKSVFDGYRLAYDLHQDETGLVFIHLNKTQELGQNVVVKDKIGRSHTIDLDSTVFLLQFKGETLRTVMNKALSSGDLSLAKKRIRQIFDLYVSEYRKGIYDRDHGVMHNTGFVGEKPIHLDVGKLSREEQMKHVAVYKQDLEIIFKKIDRWYKANYPQYYDELVKDMHEKFTEVTSG